MRTAQWSTYTGSGRIMLAKPPANLPRPYRSASAPFYLGTKQLDRVTVWTMFAMADPAAVWRTLHTLVVPYEPVLCSASPAGVESYRVLLALWLSSNTGETITEVEDPESNRGLKVRPTLYGLHPSIWPADPSPEAGPEQV